MFKNLYPTICAKSVYDMDFDALYEAGYRGLIFDIDNTLVGHDEPADDKAINLLKGLMTKEYKVCLLSNNKGPRVYAFNENINAYVICDAKKPSGDGYIRAVEEMQLNKNEIIAFGDQIFTDIWGANRADIEVVMVERLFPKETKLIYLKRILEKPIMFFYRKYNKKHPQDLFRLKKHI